MEITKPDTTNKSLISVMHNTASDKSELKPEDETSDISFINS